MVLAKAVLNWGGARLWRTHLLRQIWVNWTKSSRRKTPKMPPKTHQHHHHPRCHRFLPTPHYSNLNLIKIITESEFSV
jgi:hypothetical protein